MMHDFIDFGFGAVIGALMPVGFLLVFGCAFAFFYILMGE